MAGAPAVPRSELGDALRACRAALVGVGILSCVINLLYLTGSIFMLEIYDRVLPSRSVPTLIGLVVLAGGLYVAQGVLDLLRGDTTFVNERLALQYGIPLREHHASQKILLHIRCLLPTRMQSRMPSTKLSSIKNCWVSPASFIGRKTSVKNQCL